MFSMALIDCPWFFGVTETSETLAMIVNFDAPREKSRTLAWVKRFERLAEKEKAHPLLPEKLAKELPEIIKFSEKVEKVFAMPEVLSNCSLRFVVTPHLPGTYIDVAAGLNFGGFEGGICASRFFHHGPPWRSRVLKMPPEISFFFRFATSYPDRLEIWFHPIDSSIPSLLPQCQADQLIRIVRHE